MDENFDPRRLRVPRIGETPAVERPGDREGGGQRRYTPPQSAPELAGDHFAELTAALANAHRRLVAAGSPYRFCVHREGSELIIDLVRLGPDGKIADLQQKNITHDDLQRWLDHIDKGEGMFFDGCG